MKLKSIKIEKYRSIEDIFFNISVRDDMSFTYGLIGINEAGKSSILKAIGLKEGLVDESGTKLPLQKDFRSNEEIKITYRYDLLPENDKELYDVLNKDNSEILHDSTEDRENVSTVTDGENIQETKKVNKKISDPLSLDYIVTFSQAGADSEYSISVFKEENKIEINNKNEFNELINKNVHKTIFWTAEDRYLISKPINIEQFIADTNISIPLRNCFLLASISENDIKQKLNDALKDTTECEHLEQTLGENVTEHIKSAWPNHPIKITFKIMDGHINFHVKDIDTKGKAQTSDMRSDGFKQFVSFLLTIAAENKNEELKNTILLLDEPETHLHPKAQEYLLTQLISITNNNKNNIVFFATHSNYMIDKKDLGKYYRIEKKKDQNKDEHTHVSQFNRTQTSYAEVSYEVFDILDEQYHNELYDKLRDQFINDKNSKESDATKHIDTIGINAFDEQYFVQVKKIEKNSPDTSKGKDKNSKVTLPTFVRNCIHYPVNKKDNFDDELRKSIALLRESLQENITKSENSNSNKNANQGEIKK